MRAYLPLALILVVVSFYCNSTVFSYPAAVIQQGARNAKSSDWKAISSLTDKAYSEYDKGNKSQAFQLFAEGAAKLETYLRKYETNPAQLSYLRVLVHLGALYQNADNLDQARIVFEQCERHRLFNSPAATLRLMDDGKQEQTIANYVKAQLCFLTKCAKPEYKAAREVVRVSGSSRGEEIAPPFSFPVRNVQHPNRR